MNTQYTREGYKIKTGKIKFQTSIFIICFLIAALKPLSAQEPRIMVLAKPQFDRGKLLMESLKERKSGRSFASREIEGDILSNLLWAAFGINRPESNKRTAPSAMNQQEINIYVAMKNGLYIYDAARHALVLILEKDIRGLASRQDFMQKAPLTLIYVADFERMAGTIEEKNFCAAIDTGFISQNVYLFCASEGLTTVAVTWLDKPLLEKAMNLRGNQKIILVQPVGYSK